MSLFQPKSHVPTSHKNKASTSGKFKFPKLKYKAASSGLQTIKSAFQASGPENKAVRQLNRLTAHFQEKPTVHRSSEVPKSYVRPQSNVFEYETDESDDEEDPDTSQVDAPPQTYIFDSKYCLVAFVHKFDHLYNRIVTDNQSGILVLVKTISKQKRLPASYLELSRIEKDDNYMTVMLLMVSLYVRGATQKTVLIDCRDFTDEKDFLLNCKHVYADFIRRKSIIW